MERIKSDWRDRPDAQSTQSRVPVPSDSGFAHFRIVQLAGLAAFAEPGDRQDAAHHWACTAKRYRVLTLLVDQKRRWRLRHFRVASSGCRRVRRPLQLRDQVHSSMPGCRTRVSQEQEHAMADEKAGTRTWMRFLPSGLVTSG